ncbi:hypothetical protein QBC43DRAFT_41975 [Cladorrhinum sp. PSN259]|nr:hypothetical protein QBC43DRAFT_41975 [Cladorrhinum sp. PSN259]
MLVTVEQHGQGVVAIPSSGDSNDVADADAGNNSDSSDEPLINRSRLRGGHGIVAAMNTAVTTVTSVGADQDHDSSIGSDEPLIRRLSPRRVAGSQGWTMGEKVQDSADSSLSSNEPLIRHRLSRNPVAAAPAVAPLTTRAAAARLAKQEKEEKKTPESEGGSDDDSMINKRGRRVQASAPQAPPAPTSRRGRHLRASQSQVSQRPSKGSGRGKDETESLVEA